MKNYKIKHWAGNIFLVYHVGDEENVLNLFQGTIEEVNAWISLKEKGYEF